MKRRLISELKTYDNEFDSYVPIDIPEDLKDYAGELRLLKNIPFSYLLSDTDDLSEESIRFFIVDVNWTDALLDGAFSIGRICKQDYLIDRFALNSTNQGSDYMSTRRMKRMHYNHKNQYREELDGKNGNSIVDYSLVSGFIMRSELVYNMKGLLLYGYDKDGAPKDDLDDGIPLNILRMDTISDDILICFFQGKVSEILIAEPKTGLKIGVSNINKTTKKISRHIDLRSAVDDKSFGDRIKSVCIDAFTDDNGRLHPKKLAKVIEDELRSENKLGNDKITPSRFAYEMIAVSHRAKFLGE